MKHPRKTCALVTLALTTLPAVSTRADVGVLPVAASQPATRMTTSVQATPNIARHDRRVSGTRKHWLGHKSAAKSLTLPSLNASISETHLVASNSDAIRPIAARSALPMYPATRPAPLPLPAPLPTAPAPAPAFVSSGPAVTLNKSLSVGDSEVYEFDNITTTAVSDPTVADIVPLSTKRLLVNAKGSGRATIFVYDRHGKNVIYVTVTPGSNMAPIAARIQDEIGIPTVTVHSINDTIFLEGTVDTTGQSTRAEAIAGAYATKVKNLIRVGVDKVVQSEAEVYAGLLSDNLKGIGITVSIVDDHTIALSGKYAAPIVALVSQQNYVDANSTTSVSSQATKDPLTRLLASLPGDLHVVNLINFQTRQPQQILVRAKVVDINRSAVKTLGVNWGSLNETITKDALGNITTTATFQEQPILFGQPVGGAGGNFLQGGGVISRFLPIGAQLNALVTDNKARILSEPRIMVLDGNEGSILIGGQIPIPVAQSGAAGGAISVAYEPYGIRLNVTPTIVGDHTVQMTVTPEVSELDFGNAVQVNGTVLPALTIRRVTSTLQMEDGQTLVIGGLYSNRTTKSIKAIPLLSKVPILGEFFKNTITNKNESELMILIEAVIVNSTTSSIVPAQPGTLENPTIAKPYVPRHEFDQDYPDIEKYFNGNRDKKEAPKHGSDFPSVPATNDPGK